MNGRQPRSLRFKIIILNCSIILISMALLVSFLLFSQVAFSLFTCVTVSRSVISDFLLPHDL